MRDLLGPQIKQAAPMLRGRFLTAGQPGKPVCLLWRNVFCLFSGWEFVLWYWVVWVVCIFCILTSCQSHPLQIFSPILQATFFISLMVSFAIRKLFIDFSMGAVFFFFLNFTILYRNSTGLFEWAQCNHKGIKWGKWEAEESKTSRWHHMAIFGFENGERFWARECRKPLEAHKGKIKYNSPRLEPSEGSTALPTLWF